jgi:hypothetical protein
LAPSIDKTGVVFGDQCNEIGVVQSTDAASVTPSTLSFFIVSSLKPPDKDSPPPRIPNQWYQGVRSIFNRAARCRRPLLAYCTAVFLLARWPWNVLLLILGACCVRQLRERHLQAAVDLWSPRGSNVS